jgi:hypothetical protein
MRNSHLTFRLAACLSGLLLFAGVVPAGEKKLMHCFAFTAVESASDADWQAFFKATDALTSKIDGVSRVWYGKLRSPLTITRVNPAGEATKVQRQWGVCMEMNDEAALKTYAGHPAHKEWNDAYSKVRTPGTTTFDILGQ